VAEHPPSPEQAPGPPTPDAPVRGLASLAREAPRKLVHMALASVAILLAWMLPPLAGRVFFLAAALIALGVDAARLRWPALGRAFRSVLEPVLRPAEDRRLTGGTMLALGFAITVLLFPRAIAVAGLGYAAYADAAGALVGRAWGAHRFASGKSVEGAMAFAIVAFLVGWATPALGPGAAAIVAVLLALLESAPLRFDDNLLVPIAGAGLAWIVSALS
jgi:dolichol kinase